MAFGGIFPDPFLPYAIVDGHVIVAFSPIYISLRACSQHGMTSYCPRTNEIGSGSSLLIDESKICPLVNLPV